MTGPHSGRPAGGASAAGSSGASHPGRGAGAARGSGPVEPRFDELIHAPTRLSIVALLAAAEWADFKFIRDSLNLSDSALSKQLSALDEVGYVEIHKGYVGKRPRTSVKLSRQGRDAFTRHVAALQQIVGPARVSVLPA